MLTKFTGFKGKCAFAQIGNLRFALITRTNRELQLLWAAVMEDVPLDPRGVKSAILIEAAALPDKVGRRSPSAPHQDARDNATLEAEALSLTPGFSQVPPATREPKTVSTVSPTIEV